MKRLLLALLTLSFAGGVLAQSTDNKCWAIDYETWNNNGTPQLFINCGNNEAFNMGEELTMEVWVRAYTFGENRKMMGKCMYNDPFDNGYILGFENLHVYAEYFNPTQQEVPRPGDGPMPADSSFVHIASTYSAVTGQIKNYVNGILSGETTMFPANAIAENDYPFIIGNAPWDSLSFQFYGDMDEVRVWNTARTAEQLYDNMFTALKGDEEGLVAYYNFNETTDALVPDAGPNGFDGNLSNHDHISTQWAISGAPVADAVMRQHKILGAAWFTNTENYHKISSDEGFTFITNIQENEYWKYAVAGHNELTGVATDFAPDQDQANFERTSREWYVKTADDLMTNIIFNFENAAGGETELSQDGDPENYALLYRESTDEAFVALAFPVLNFQGILQFEDIDLNDGYYAVGQSTEDFVLMGTEGLEEEYFNSVTVAPNPANNLLSISGLQQGCNIRLLDIRGNTLQEKKDVDAGTQFNIQNLACGIYLVAIEIKGYQHYQKIIKK